MATDQKTLLTDLASDLADKRVELEEAQAVVKELQDTHDQYQERLFTALEDAGITSFRSERGLFSLNDLAWPAVEDEQALREWCEAYMPELLTANRQRLAVPLRRALRGEEVLPGTPDGQELPPGLSYRLSRKITWRRA